MPAEKKQQTSQTIAVTEFNKDPAKVVKQAQTGSVVVVGDPAAPRLVISAPRVDNK